MNKHYPHYPPPPPYWYAPPQAGAQYPGYPPQFPMAAPMQAPQAPNLAAQAANNSLLGSNFVKGALVGAVAAYLLTNENVQQAVIKTAVKSWAMVQGGVEEMKERFRDAEAELHAADFDEE